MLGTFKKISILCFCIFCFINQGRALACCLPVSKCRKSCQFVFFQKIHFSRSTLDSLSLCMDCQIVEGSPSVNWSPFLSLSVKLGVLLQIIRPKELQPPPQSTKAFFREGKCGKLLYLSPGSHVLSENRMWGGLGPSHKVWGWVQESGLVVWPFELVPTSLALRGMKSPCIF